MYCGMAFIIHDKDAYYANKEQIKAILNLRGETEGDICKASTVEYKGNLFLIIDGHNSLLDWRKPDEELEEMKAEMGDETGALVDRRFLHNFLLLSYPDYEKNYEEFYDANWYKGFYETYCRIEQAKELDAETKAEMLAELRQAAKGTKMEVTGDDYKEQWAKIYKNCSSRARLCNGFTYFDEFEVGAIAFEEEEKKMKKLSKDIFNATVNEKNVKDVKFIETLYERKR